MRHYLNTPAARESLPSKGERLSYTQTKAYIERFLTISCDVSAYQVSML